jgi:hypothetical protein
MAIQYSDFLSCTVQYVIGKGLLGNFYATIGLDFYVFLHLPYLTLLHLPPIRFHCVGGCWDRNRDCCDFGIGSHPLIPSKIFGMKLDIHCNKNSKHIFPEIKLRPCSVGRPTSLRSRSTRPAQCSVCAAAARNATVSKLGG